MASDKQPAVLQSLQTCKQAFEQKCKPEKFRFHLGLKTHLFHNEAASFLHRVGEEQKGRRVKIVLSFKYFCSLADVQTSCPSAAAILRLCFNH